MLRMHHSQFSIQVAFVPALSSFIALWLERLQLRIFYFGAARSSCMKDKRLFFLLPLRTAE